MSNAKLTYAVRIGQGAHDYYDSTTLRETVHELGGTTRFRGCGGTDNCWYYEITLPEESMAFFKLKYGKQNENIND
jgi:hypothetical protein